MPRRRFILIVVTASVAGLAALAFWTRNEWAPWLQEPSVETTETQDAHIASNDAKILELSEQARRNLSLVSKPLKPETYWRSIQVPGVIEERPGISDRGVVAPAVSVVARIHISPGDTLKPGDPLFTLRLSSEYLQNTQAELFKNAQDIQITKEQLARLEGAATAGAVPGSRIIELENQLKRLTAAADAYRQDLMTRGLTAAQVEEVSNGKFVIDIEVVSPPPRTDVAVEAGVQPVAFDEKSAEAKGTGNELEPVESLPVYEVQELKVELGQQVQAGEALCLLSNHRALFIEGHTFKREASYLERTLHNGWPVNVEFAEDDSQAWPPLKQTFRIRHLANSVDLESRTFAFFVPLINQSRSHENDGRTYLVWRFRPGQRVRLHVPVEEMKDVIVLPAAAVAREGPEAFAFRQNGDLFHRMPVHVLYEDRLNVVVANDGSIPAGSYLAQGAAASLNRVLKAQSSSGGMPPGFHVHADGSVHGAH
ncbi:MAG: efflux RND transporter periplasmic adaptor subunit [Planctomycetaceae bacterium]